MMDLYFFTTTNGYRARLALEEMGIPYNLHLVQLPQRENLTDEFRRISPSHKIPTLIDPDGPGGPITLIESGAIMKYLAEKTESPLYPTDARARVLVDQWFFYAASTLQMTQTQLGLFTLRFPEDVPPAKTHYLRETKDHYSVIDAHLAGRDWFADAYSLADMAHYPYVRNAPAIGIAIEEYPNIKRWYDVVSARPAVERAYAPVA